MTTAEIRQFIIRELPVLFREDVEIHQFILTLTSKQFAGKQETESRFDRILDQLQRDREEDQKKWEEQNRKWEEQNRKWDEQNQKWRELLQEQRAWREEQNRKWDEQNQKWNAHVQDQQTWREEQKIQWQENQKTIQRIFDRLDAFSKKFETSIGAIGSRWGFQAEESFRNALKSILEESFGVQVLNVTDFDDTGEVFGHPDQIELDVIIKNGLLIICEIKSSMSRADVYEFSRKIAFYERLHQCQADRRIVITPMIRDRARRTAAKLDIEVFSYADEVTL